MSNWTVYIGEPMDGGQEVEYDTREEAESAMERLRELGFYPGIEDNRPYYWVDDYRPYFKPGGPPPPLGLGALDRILRECYTPALGDNIFQIAAWLPKVPS